MTLSFRERFVSFLSETEKIKLPERNNALGRILARMYMYRLGEKYFADKRAEAETEFLDTFDMTNVPLHPGSNMIVETGKFFYVWDMSKPRKTFSPETLADLLHGNYGVPKEETLRLIEKAKIPGSSSITKKVIPK